MKVERLIEILQGADVDPNAQVLTHANNHTMSSYDDESYEELRVCLMKHSQILIGNVSKRNLDGQCEVVKAVDGGKRIPKEW